MVHDKRHYSIAKVDYIEFLAKKLFEHTWCLCNGFECEGLLALNDSFSPDGAQEYAIFRKDPGTGKWKQVESLTVSWYESEHELFKELKKLSENPSSGVRMGTFEVRTHPPNEPCCHCA